MKGPHFPARPHVVGPHIAQQGRFIFRNPCSYNEQVFVNGVGGVGPDVIVGAGSFHSFPKVYPSILPESADYFP
jgi:hypothetical protein